MMLYRLAVMAAMLVGCAPQEFRPSTERAIISLECTRSSTYYKDIVEHFRISFEVQGAKLTNVNFSEPWWLGHEIPSLPTWQGRHNGDSYSLTRVDKFFEGRVYLDPKAGGGFELSYELYQLPRVHLAMVDDGTGDCRSA